MNLIDASGKIVATLTDVQKWAMKRTYGMGGPASSVDRTIARDIFNDMTSGDPRRLTCDCRRERGKEAPLLVAVSPKDIEHYVRRQAGTALRSDHDEENCDFARSPAHQIAIVDAMDAPAPEVMFSFHEPFVAGTEEDHDPLLDRLDQSERRRYASARRPKLGRLLAKLIVDAKLNLMPKNGWLTPFDKGLQAMLRVAAGLRVNSRLSICDILHLGPGGVDRLMSVFAATSDWPPGTRKHLLYLTKIAGYPNGRHELREEKRVSISAFRDAIHAPGEHDDLSRAPYLALATYAQLEPGTAETGLVRGFAQPTFAEFTCFPVDSGLERITLKQLKECQRALSPEGIAFTVEKPMFNISSVRRDGEVEECIPDFIVHVVSARTELRQFVVETLGTAKRTYRERKDRTHKRMRQIGPVIRHCAHLYHDCKPDRRPLEQENEAFKERLKAALRGQTGGSDTDPCPHAAD